MMTATVMAAYGAKAQYINIGQTTTPGVGIGVPLGPNYGDAAFI